VTFDIAWTVTPGILSATLWQRCVIEGRPASRRICQLGDLGEADQFWRDVRARLGRKHRFSGADIVTIEALIAIKVPRPMPATSSQSAAAHPGTHPIRGAHTPLSLLGLARRAW
jgi:hypothetical protein